MDSRLVNYVGNDVAQSTITIIDKQSYQFTVRLNGHIAHTVFVVDGYVIQNEASPISESFTAKQTTLVCNTIQDTMCIINSRRA